MNLNLILPAIKPMIKPAFESLEKSIIENLHAVEVAEGCENGILIIERDGKLIVAPVNIDNNDKISINKQIMTPQPLVHFILKNFNSALKTTK
jgi:hypothetical protein